MEGAVLSRRLIPLISISGHSWTIDNRLGTVHIAKIQGFA